VLNAVAAAIGAMVIVVLFAAAVWFVADHHDRHARDWFND